ILTTAIVSGLVSAIVGIHGKKESAGFVYIGMVGPINAFKFMDVDYAWLSVLLIVVALFVVPFVTAWLSDIIYSKV
ncbi:PTS sugar transporter subunit IIC, partial [Staphylococcus aureus]|nr:PTS sugar transporter subunit IIC [Staphylococcus aureus]